MRKLKTIVCLFAILALGCSKDSGTNPNSSSIKVLDTNTNYSARSILTLPDGSAILASVALEDESNASNYGANPSLLAKYNPQGDLDWVIELPNEVYVLWKCILLSNGNILAVGYNDEIESESLGAVILNSDGDVLHLESFNSPLVGSGLNNLQSSVDVIQSQDGKILVVAPYRLFSTAPMTLRILVLNTELSIIDDILYSNMEDLEQNGLQQITIEQAIGGEFFISGRIFRTAGILINPFMGLLKLNSNFTVVYSKIFSATSTPFEDSFGPSARTEISSNIALDASGSPVFVASLRNPSDSLFEPIFNLRDQDYFMRAPQLGLWHVTSPDVDAPINQISGFPSNAIIQKIKCTSDGGFILVGTCGINTNQSIPSNYKLLIAKLDASLNLQWMNFPQMRYATLGADVIESDGGYIVAATQYSLGETNKPIFMRIDQNGIIK